MISKMRLIMMFIFVVHAVSDVLKHVDLTLCYYNRRFDDSSVTLRMAVSPALVARIPKLNVQLESQWNNNELVKSVRIQLQPMQEFPLRKTEVKMAQMAIAYYVLHDSVLTGDGKGALWRQAWSYTKREVNNLKSVYAIFQYLVPPPFNTGLFDFWMHILDRYVEVEVGLDPFFPTMELSEPRDVLNWLMKFVKYFLLPLKKEDQLTPEEWNMRH